LNPECESLWVNLAPICFELCIENPFLFDLINSESYDWEANSQLYAAQRPTDQPSGQIAPLASLLTHLLQLQKQKQMMFKHLMVQ
jgi:hypothetical protein